MSHLSWHRGIALFRQVADEALEEVPLRQLRVLADFAADKRQEEGIPETPKDAEARGLEWRRDCGIGNHRGLPKNAVL